VGSGGELTVTGGANNSQSYLDATYQGPGLLSWSWKTQVQQGNDALVCFVNGVEIVRISAKKGVWEDQVYTLPEGVCNVRWVYQKDAISWTGQDKVWLGAVAYRPFEGPRISMSQWMASVGLVAPQVRTLNVNGASSVSASSVASQPLAGGMSGMLAFLGGVNPVAGPAAGEYVPIVANGKFCYRYGISKQASGNMQQRPVYTSDLAQWSNQGISQRVISEDENRIVVEVSVPTDTIQRGFYRMDAWGDPN
jgi:hypothetical protein